MLRCYDHVIPREQRFCTLCNIQVIEDEFHLMFTYPIYNCIRTEYYLPLHYVSYTCGK